jgi:hypothetical protein
MPSYFHGLSNADQVMSIVSNSYRNKFHLNVVFLYKVFVLVYTVPSSLHLDPGLSTCGVAVRRKYDHICCLQSATVPLCCIAYAMPVLTIADVPFFA